MNRFSILLLLLGAFASLAAAASAPTFCKCTCFTNSTIIEIKSKSSTAKSSTPLGSSSHLKLPSEDDTTTTTDQDEPAALDPRSILLDFEGDNDNDAADLTGLLFSPPPRAAAQRRDSHHPTDHPQPNSRPRSRRRSNSDTHPHPRPKRAQVSPSCNQCNKAFCLSQSLPICKDAADKDVVTMCFQRDSRKDQIIVWGFILGTAGLLGWAGAQKVVAMRERGGSLSSSPAGWLSTGGSLAGMLLPRRIREGVRVGAGGAAGRDAGRGAYAAVGGHSRDSSIQTSIGG